MIIDEDDSFIYAHMASGSLVRIYKMTGEEEVIRP